MSHESLLERAKNPTEKSLVGRALKAGRKAISFAQDNPELRKAKKFVEMLDDVGNKSRDFPEGVFYYRGNSFRVEQEGNDTHIVSKNAVPGNGIVLYDYTQICIERDEEKLLSVNMLSLRTKNPDLERVDYEPFGDYKEKHLYPLPLDASSEDRIKSIKPASTCVALTKAAIKDSRSGMFLDR